MDGEIMENPIKMDDLGGPPLFLETPRDGFSSSSFCKRYCSPGGVNQVSKPQSGETSSKSV